MTAHSDRKQLCAEQNTCLRKGCTAAPLDDSAFCADHLANQQRRQRESMRRYRARGGRKQLLFTSILR